VIRGRAWAAAFAVALCGCGSRPASWEAASDFAATPIGLSRGAVVLDTGRDRAVVFTALAQQALETTFLPIGHGGITAMASPDGERLFVLTGGDAPTASGTAQPPMLTVISIDSATFQPSEVTYPMLSPLGGLAIDPSSQWAVAYDAAFANGDTTNTPFVQNPNELAFFDLSKPTGTQPQSYQLTSFSGSPVRLTFTPTLSMPAGPGRLLVVEATTSDVHLVDLAHVFDNPPLPEVVIRLTSAQDSTPVTPQGLAIAPADAPGNPRMAVRTSSSDVISWVLGPPDPGNANSFQPTLNVTGVLGVPSDIAFVNTDAGLRIAAMVPSTSSVVLVDPDTSLITTVSLPSNFNHLSLVTDAVGGTNGSDVALLWGTNSTGVDLLSLGVSVDRSYDAAEYIGVGVQVTAVDDVPAPNQTLKILETSGGTEFFVLDLINRTVSPLSAASSATLSISPDDGARVWAFAKGTTSLASVDLLTRQSTPLTTVLPISSAFEVARAGSVGGRSLLVVSLVGTLGVSVFDAIQPASAVTRSYADILLEGL